MQPKLFYCQSDDWGRPVWCLVHTPFKNVVRQQLRNHYQVGLQSWKITVIPKDKVAQVLETHEVGTLYEIDNGKEEKPN